MSKRFRHALLPAAIAGALLLVPAPVFAAPTCFNRAGDGVRCGTPGAMPVGWSPSPEQFLKHEMSLPPAPGLGDVLPVILGIAALLALIALMPEFDGSRGADWDEQEGDEEGK